MRAGYRALLMLGAALLLAMPWLLDSEEDRIVGRLEALRDLVVVAGPESAIEQASRARRIAGFFSLATMFDLTNAGYGVTAIGSRQELMERIVRARALLSTLELSMEDAAVTINGDTARVEVRGSARGARRDREEAFFEVHRVEIALIREQDEWLVAGARHIRDEGGAAPPQAD